MFFIYLLSCSQDQQSDTSISTENTEDIALTTDFYSFPNEFGEETVSYSGQVFRHVLIHELTNYIDNLTTNIDNASIVFGTTEEVVASLNFYVNFDSNTSGEVPLSFEKSLQQVYNDISQDKNLIEKLAGNDTVTDHKNWNDGAFQGWSNASSPQALLQEWFTTIGSQSISRISGDYVVDIHTPVYVTPEGQDLKQLSQKFLLGAVVFSQGADDYLDDDIENKGILSSNVLEEGQTYSELAHAWDEGFGYFGAAQNYMQYTDVQIAEGLYIDSNNDGFLDLHSEKNWGHSVNAAKRDLGSQSGTDFTHGAWMGFWEGRALIHSVSGNLSEAQRDQLKIHRNQVLDNWEKSISATVVHYINEVLGDMKTFGTDEFSFVNLAKHWSEMKGFSLGLQFNPHSPVSESDFLLFHQLVGDAPTLPSASEEAITEYQQNLLEARSILQDTYLFEDIDMGNEKGENGW